MRTRWRRATTGIVAVLGLVAFGSAEAKPTRIGPDTGTGTGTTTGNGKPEGTGKKNPVCRACMLECDQKRIRCVPVCGKSKAEASEKQQKCVSSCFTRAAFCHRDCDKTKCKE